jgi:general secretion pathway protein A
VPRVINVICDRALLGAYTQDRHSISGSLVRSSASEVFGRRVAPRWVPWVAVAGTVLFITLAGVLLWQLKPTFKAVAAQAKDALTTPAPAQSVSPSQTPTNAVVAPAPGTPAALSTAVRGPSLSDLLARSANETDPDSAFLKLFGLWNVRYVVGNTDPCAQATKQGLECFVQRGSLAQLRIYNRPAILLLNDDLGAAHQVVLSGLTDESARILLAAKTHDVGIAELSRYWFGDFIILWKPPVKDPKPLTFGMKGEEVRWLRQNLQQLKGVPVNQPVSDVYDAELSTLVRNFQREHRLEVDGVAGLQTLVVLNSATATADTPMLQASATLAHGS